MQPDTQQTQTFFDRIQTLVSNSNIFHRLHSTFKETSKDSKQDKTEGTLEGTSYTRESFSGIIQTSTGCKNCPETSCKTSTEEFLMLSLPVANTLDQILENLLKEKEESIKCRNCNQPLIEQKNLIKLPSVLVIHFDRSDFGGGRSWKVNKLIDFSLNNVNFGKYLAKSDGAKHNESKQYNLFAVCNQYGTLDEGHNTASCFSPEERKWFNFNDEEVKEINEDNIITKNAYILFYAKKS